MRNYSVMLCQTYNVIFRSWSFSVIFIFNFHPLKPLYPRPQRVFRQSLSLLRRKEGTDMKSPKAWKMEYMKSTAKEVYDTLAVL